MSCTCIACVVKYLFSTSNHNCEYELAVVEQLSNIFFLHQTTTKNASGMRMQMLSNIFFLHQTTTSPKFSKTQICCQISFFYIKPQPTVATVLHVSRCQISFFYIKPQLKADSTVSTDVVKYLFSTSNHNLLAMLEILVVLSNIFFLHQTTTQFLNDICKFCCQISFFYIKPQRVI